MHSYHQFLRKSILKYSARNVTKNTVIEGAYAGAKTIFSNNCYFF